MSSRLLSKRISGSLTAPFSVGAALAIGLGLYGCGGGAGGSSRDGTSDGVDVGAEILGAVSLSFEVQPTTAGPGKTLDQIKVVVVDKNGRPVFDHSTKIHLKIAQGPGQLSGTPQLFAPSGFAKFNNLSIDLEGKYKLVASASGLGTTLSQLFTVSAWKVVKRNPDFNLVNSAMVYDANLDALLVYGGLDRNLSATDTFQRIDRQTGIASIEFDRSPGDRFGHNMIFDSMRNRTVLFGGTDALNSLDSRTWIFKGRTWSADAAIVTPNGRLLAAMAFDELNGQVVLFGGRNFAGANDETWVWDGQSDWQQVAKAGSRPEPRDSAAMAYDKTNGRVVLFGGNDPAGTQFMNDTWVFDGIHLTWTELTIAGPSPRNGHSLTEHPASGTLILFGGLTAAGEVSDTWELNNTTWREIPITSPPSARTGHAATADRVDGELYILGGEGVNAPVRDLEDLLRYQL